MLMEIARPGSQVKFPLLLLIIGIAFLIIYIYMAQYIYKDAVKRKLNAEVWLLIVLMFPIASWIVYFIVRNVKSRYSDSE
jgi:hypothetical protein